MNCGLSTYTSNIHNVASIGNLTKGDLEGLQMARKGQVNVRMNLTRGEKKASTYSVTWDPAKNKFQVEKQGKGLWNWLKSSFSHGIWRGHLTSRASRIAAALNKQWEKMAKETKSPKGAFVEEKPIDEANFSVVTQKGHEEWTPEMLKSQLIGEKIQLEDGNEPPRIFLYGLGMDRSTMQVNLQTKTDIVGSAKLETIDEYNACLGIKDNANFFEDYVEILDQARNGRMNERMANNKDGRLATGANKNEVNKQALSNFASGYPGESVNNDTKLKWQEQRVKEWAAFLERPENHKQLGFSRKVVDRDKALQFFVKNFATDDKVTRKLEGFHMQDMRKAVESVQKGETEPLKMALAPIFDLLSMVDEPEVTPEKLKEKYKTLSKSQQVVLNDLASTAFLRQTSKLGLKFARKSGAKVLFSWSGLTPDFRDIFEAKPWHDLKSRNKRYSEPITYSEMRHVERLIKKSAAPDVFKINAFNKPVGYAKYNSQLLSKRTI